MLKEFTRIQFYFLVAFAATLFSTHIHARELPGNWTPAPQLGSAYFSNKHKVTAVKCVEATTLPKVGQAVGDLKYTNEASFEKIASAFGGSISANLSVPFVKAGASLTYARENAATDTRMNWFFEFHATPKSEKMDDADLKVSASGERARQNRVRGVAEICGDEFVYQIDYGAKLIATMSIEFASKEDKTAFEAAAHVDVNFVAGSASASGSINKMNQRMGSRTTVKVEAHQTGGNPGELSAILQAGVVDCNLSNMSQCLNTFGEVVRYANNNFRNQLIHGDGYSVVRYHTMPYVDSAAFDLEPDGGFPMLQETVKRKRAQIQEEYENQAIIYDKANYIRNKLRHFTPPNQLVQVEDIFRRSFANMTTLTEAMELCLANPDQGCLNQPIDLQTYDRANLEVKVTEQLDPNSNLGKLHQAVKDNDVNAADQTIRFGGNQLITQCDPQGFNACHRSVEKGHTRLLSLFIEEDPYKDVADKRIVHTPCDNAQKYTPLHLAAEGGTFEHVRCMDLLCAQEAGVDCKTASGLTPLQVAVSCGNKETADKLVSMGADVKIQDVEYRTLLHLAAAAGNVDAISYLIDNKGLIVNARDQNQMMPLHYAAKNGHLQAVVILLRHGAINDAKDRSGKMPIHWAIEHEKVFEKLLEFYELPVKGKDIWRRESNLQYGCQQFAFSPDNSRIAMSGAEGTITIMDASRSQAFMKYFPIAPKQWSYGVAYSDDGRLLAGHDGYTGTKVWELNSGRELHSCFGGSNSHTLDFRPHGYVLAVGNFDGIVTLWAANNGEKIRSLPKFPQHVNSLKFSPDGNILAVAAKGVTLWNPENGQLIRTLLPDHSSINSLSFSADGAFIGASANGNDQKARIWNVNTGELVRTLDSGSGGGLAFSPRDNILALSYYNGKNTIEFWDIKNWQLLYETIASSEMVGKLKFNSLGSELGSTDGTSYLKLWNLRWDSILHHGVRAGNLNVVQRIVEKFPLLLFIRTPHGQLPLDLAEELLLNQGHNINPDIQSIIDYLRR